MFKKLRNSRAAVVGVCCALAGAAVVPVVGWAGITGSTGDGPMVVQSGESTLTYQARLNVSSIVGSEPAIWSRTGDTVTQTGVVAITATATGATTSVYIPTAVDSNINGSGCQGLASITGGPAPGRVLGISTAGHTHQCAVEYTAVSTGTQYIYYTMNYRMKN